MKLIRENNLTTIVAEEGKHIREVGDVYIEEKVNEDGTKEHAHEPYYSTIIYVPATFTEEQMNELYVEENIEE